MRKRSGMSMGGRKPVPVTPQVGSSQETPSSQSRISPRRKLWFIVTILAVIGILQEPLFRYAFPLPEVEGFNRINHTQTYAFASAISGNPKSGLSNIRILWESEPDSFVFEHTLNLYGFRGADFAIDPPTDRPRVLFIGDSFVEGCGAADGDTIPIQFARIAAKTSDANTATGRMHEVDSINLGIAGSNFPQYTTVLRDSVPLLRPTAVFVVLCPNDLPAEPLTEEVAAPSGEFPRLSPYVPRVLAVLDRLRRGLVVPSRRPTGPFPFFEPVPGPSNPFTLHLRDYMPANIDPAILDAMRRGKTNPHNSELGTFYERVLRHDFRIGGGAEDYLEHMQSICKEHNSRFILAYIPHLCTANPAYIPAENKFGGPGFGRLTRVDQPPYRNQQEHLTQVCRQQGIPFLDMTEEFIAGEKTQRLYWPYDGHCNAAGYHLAAAICARYWTTGALPKPSSDEK